jgi:hypothetical protein
MDSKYIFNYEEYVKSNPDEVNPAWADYYKSLMEDEDQHVYTFILQYIFM